MEGFQEYIAKRKQEHADNIARRNKEHADKILILEKNISDCLKQLNKSNDYESKCLKKLMKLSEDNIKLIGVYHGLERRFDNLRATEEATIEKLDTEIERLELLNFNNYQPLGLFEFNNDHQLVTEEEVIRLRHNAQKVQF